MKQISMYFKSDFTVILASEGEWGGAPFRLKLWTASPAEGRSIKACFDGEVWHNCRLLDDGRLQISVNQGDLGERQYMGIGTLKMDIEFYLTNADFNDHVCNEHIKTFEPVFVDTDGEEYKLYLDNQGASTLTTIGTLPAFYQAGLTPEEHQALVDATERAERAADNTEQAVENANRAAQAADDARTALVTAYNDKVAALDADYASKKQALDADYANTKRSITTDYATVKAQLDADYAQKKAQLAQDYATAIAGINDRMTAIESLYTTDKAEWQRQVDAILAKCVEDFEAAEAQREARVNTAVQSATEATAQVNTAVQKASNVNAVLNGDNITVTDQNGNAVTRNIRGPKGDSVTMFPNVTIFGQPTIQESQISNFSADNYLQFPFVVDFAGRPWQIDCAITTGSNVSQQHNVLDSAFGLAFAFSGGKFVLALSSDGTSWNLGATSGTHTILAHNTYYIRISWNGSVYKLAYSTDKETWIDDITVTSSASLASKQIIIGKSLDNRYIFNGSINMSEAHLTISGKIVWEGMDDAGLATRMAIDMSNIDEEGKQRVNTIVNEGEVGNKLATLGQKVDTLEIDIHGGETEPITETKTLAEATKGQGIRRNGDMYQNASYAYIKEALPYGAEKIDAFAVFDNTALAGVAFYDSNGMFLSYVGNETTGYSTIQTEKTNIQIPADAAFYGVTFKDDVRENAYIKIYIKSRQTDGVIPRIENVEDSVESLSEETSTLNTKMAGLRRDMTSVESKVELIDFSSVNLLDKNDIDYIKSGSDGGKYLFSDGTLKNNSAYFTSGYIKVTPNVKYYLISADSPIKTARFVCGYDENKVFVSGTYEQNKEYIIPNTNVAYIRISNTNVVEPFAQVTKESIHVYQEYKLAINESLMPVSFNELLKTKPLVSMTDSSLGMDSNKTHTDSLASGASLSLENFPKYLKKGVSLSALAYFTTFSKLLVGKGYNTYRGKWLEIDSTNIVVKYYESAAETKNTIAHGLNISIFLSVAMSVNGDGKCKVILQTLGGHFETTIDDFGYEYNGTPFVTPNGFAATDITLSADCDDFKLPVWAFGDSYFGVNSNRWIGCIKEMGFFDFLICGLAGIGSVSGVPDFEKCLKFGTPKYVLWCIGMNDTTFDSWKDYAERVITICELKGINLILSTIPSVPERDKTSITSYVRTSGLRYIDFSKAVNGDIYTSGVSNWYDGYLSSDNLHPSILGAQALTSRVLIDFPEIMKYKSNTSSTIGNTDNDH